MGTVKYTGPVASFHCPTEATIRSLKVHFSPKQEGSGDPSPENIRPIVGWDGVVVHNDDGNVVPEEYQKVEYLEGLGSQYLITNIPIKESITIETVQIFTSNSDQYMIGAAYDDENGTAYRSSANGTYRDAVQGAYSGYFIVGSVSINSKYHIKTTLTKGSQIVIVDDKQVGSLTRAYSNAFDETKANYGIFCQYKTGTGAQFIGKAKLYSAKVYYENNVFGNFIPCRRKSDNKPGMYDTVTQTFFTNQGTGEFVCGPNVGQTTEYEFGVLGKNKFNWDVEQGHASPTTSDYMTARAYPLNTYIIGMSSSNYYRDNYTNWVLNPSVSNGTISFSSGGASGYGIGYPLKLAPNQTYFLSGETTNNGSVGAIYYDKDGALISTQIGRLNKTITVPSNTNITMIVFYAIAPNTDYTFSNIQLELGSTPTTYEPYNPNHTVYGGWVDLISGEVCEEWGSKIINGSESWHTQAPHDNFARIFLCNSTNSTMIGNSSLSKPNGMADILDVVKQNSDEKSGGRLCCRFGWGDKNFYILNAVENIPEVTDVASLKEYLSEHNIHIVYNLQTQYYNTYHIAPTALQTFLGQNNVWSNADYVEVEYDLHETQTLLQRKAFIMANQPHIASASGAIASFNTDLRAPLRECKVYFSPKQDLHGYSNPWPAGGGRNLFHVTAENRVTDTGVTFTVNSDGSVKAVGAPSTSTSFVLGTITLPEGTYKVQGGVSNTAYINISGKVNTYGSAASFTIAEGGETITPRIYITGNSEVNGTFYPMIKLNSDNDATWAPYENICPISGWTECEAYSTGKNLFGGVYGQKFPLFLPKGTVVTVSTSNTDTSNGQMRYYRKDGTQIDYWSFINNNAKLGRKWRSFSLLEDAYFFEFIATNQEYQIELGSTPTIYEPYSGTTIPITFPATINLFNEQWEQGNIEVGNNAGSTTAMRTGFINVNPSTSYYLYTSRENNVFVFEYLEDGTYANKVNGVHTSHIFTTGSTTKKIRIVDRNSGTETVSTGINYPATITYYEPYGTIYGGYVDLVTGELVQEFVSIHAKSYTWYNFSNNKIFYINKEDKSSDSVDISDKLVSYAGYNFNNSPDNSVIYGSNARLMIRHDGVSNYTEFNEWLNSIDPIICYKLATPITYQLTPTQLKTLVGTNNLWSSANGNIELKFYKH